MGWGLKINKFAYYGGSLENLVFRIGSQKRKIIYRGDCLKMEGLDSLQI